MILLVYVFAVLVVSVIYNLWRLSKPHRTAINTDSSDLLTDEERYTIENEITLIQINLDRRKEISRIYEKQLERCYDEKKKAVLLSKLNTLDSASYRDMRKLDTLFKKLE